MMYLSLLYVNVGNDPDRPHDGSLLLRDTYHLHQRLWMAFPDPKRREEDPFFLGAWDDSSTAVPQPPRLDSGAVPPKPRRDDSGFLFRIERDGRPRILVQSVRHPDWDYAFQNAPYLLARDPAHRPKVRTFDPAPRLDQTYRFRLLANVVRRTSIACSDGRTRTTKAKGLVISRRRRAEVLIHPKPMPDPLPVDPVERHQFLLTRWDPWRDWLRDIGVKNGFHIVDTKEAPLSMASVYASVRHPGQARGGPPLDQPAHKRYNAGLFDGLLVCTDQDLLRKAVINGIGNAKAFGFGLLSLAPIRDV